MAGVPLFAAKAREPPALSGIPALRSGPQPSDPLDGPLGSKFKFRRATKDSATVEWDPDDFCKPSQSSAPRSGRRVIPNPSAAPESTAPPPPPPKSLPRSNSFKNARAAAKDVCDSDSSSDSEKEWPRLPSKGTGDVSMTDPLHKRDVEISYSAMGWGRH